MKNFDDLHVGCWEGMHRIPPSIVEQTIDVLDGFQRGGKLNLETVDGVERLRNVIEYAEGLLYTWVYGRVLDDPPNGFSLFTLSPYELLQLYEAHTYEVQQVITAEITDIRLLGRHGFGGDYYRYDMGDPFALDEPNQLILIENALDILAVRAIKEVPHEF